MSVVVPFFLFYLMVLIPMMAVHPLVRLILHGVSPQQGLSRLGRLSESWISLAVGTSAFLLVMSLVARLVGDYGIASTLSLTLLFVGGWWAAKRLPNTCRPAAHFGLPLGLGVVLFVALHLLLWGLRTSFSNIHFDPGAFGAEKLFNLSLQQEFIRGSGYPPQSLWLAGEPEGYYILPRLLPGVVSNFALKLGLTGHLGGLFFHIGDTFYVALSSLLSLALVLFLSSRCGVTSRLAWLWQIPLGLSPLFAAPARAFAQLLSGGVDMWPLSRIIPDTINEYPFWNFLWADNHAHSNAAFLQLLSIAFGLIFILESPQWKDPVRKAFGLLVATIFATMFMSDSSTTMPVLVVLAPVGIGSALLAFRSGRLRGLYQAFQWSAVPAVLLLLPDLATRPQPSLQWVLVPVRMASTLADYLNVFASYAAVCGVVVLLLALSRQSPKPVRIQLAFAGVVVLLGVLSSFFWPVVGLAFGLVACGSLLVVWDDARAVPREVVALLGVLSLLAFPELVGANFNMGPEMIRFNTVFKFVYVSFYAFPVILLYVACQPLMRLSSRLQVTLGSLLVLLLVAGTIVQVYTWHFRITRTRNPGDAAGMEFLRTERPGDYALIEFLESRRETFVLAEECGFDPKPTAYGVAGRLSAYSGHPSLCGWSMHSFIHHNTFRVGARRGGSTWSYFGEVNGLLQQVFSIHIASTPEEMRSARTALNRLREFGATHLVWGEWERALHGQGSLAALAGLGLPIVFEHNGLGVLSLLASPSGL